MPEISADAIRLFGDMLEDKEEQLLDARACLDDYQINIDLRALNQLWQLYQSL